MKFLKILLAIVVVLALIFVIGTFLLPKDYSVSRSAIINAPDSVIYRNIADFNEFYKWNPFSKMDPQAKVSFAGTPMQPGHTYEWNGEKNGNGTMVLESVKPYEIIDINLRFITPMESNSRVRFTLTTEAEGTRVTWLMTGESEGAVQKWFGAMMDKMVGKDFEDGLNFLKTKSEKGE